MISSVRRKKESEKEEEEEDKEEFCVFLGGNAFFFRALFFFSFFVSCCLRAAFLLCVSVRSYSSTESLKNKKQKGEESDKSKSAWYHIVYCRELDMQYLEAREGGGIQRAVPCFLSYLVLLVRCTLLSATPPPYTAILC